MPEVPASDGEGHHAPDQGEWDDRYGVSDQIWSGEPNGTLVAEMADTAPGRALDVGCGEGADAVWLARRGWRVTAVDVSSVALDRGRAAAHDAGVAIVWLHAGLIEAELPSGTFDLVNVQYPALLRTATHAAEGVLLDVVAPGGTLLVVHHTHDAASLEEAKSHGFDPALYVGPMEVAAVLDETWQVEVSETRKRSVSTGGGAHHSEDRVLRAHRRAAPQ